MEQHLIYAFLLDGQGGAKALNQDEVALWQPDHGLLWLHFNYSLPGTREQLERTPGLDKVSVAALLAEESRPRATVHNNGLLMALRGVNLAPQADPEDMVSVRLWMDEHRIISSRKRRLLSVDDITQRLNDNRGPKNSAEFLSQLCEQLIRRIAGPIEDIEDKLDSLEETLLSSPRAKLRNELSQLRRQIISLRRYLSPQREALGWIQSTRLDWFPEQVRLQLRETADRLAQYIETLDSVRDRAAVTQEELVNQISEESNSRMYVLSIVSAIFLPLGFATGLLGINVGGIPGADNDSAFLVFIVGLAAIAGGILLFFRHKKWL